MESVIAGLTGLISGIVRRDITTGRDILRQAANTQAICAIGCQFDLDGVIIQVKKIAKIHTQRSILGQFHQTGMVVRQTQFACRAGHAK